MFLKVPEIIIIRYGENNVLGIIYINWEFEERYTVHLTFLSLLLIKI